MPSKKHITRNFRATATLLFLLLCVCGAVAREKNNTIALPFEDSVYNFLLRRICNPTQYSFGISNPNMPLLRIIASGNELKVANPQQLK